MLGAPPEFDVFIGGQVVSIKALYEPVRSDKSQPTPGDHQVQSLGGGR